MDSKNVYVKEIGACFFCIIIYFILATLDVVAIVRIISGIFENLPFLMKNKRNLVLLVFILVILIVIEVYAVHGIYLWICRLRHSLKLFNQAKNNQLPYGFDYLFELTTYRNIGEKKGVYGKFSDWKKHILETYGYLCGNDDFYRFMKGKRIGIEIQEQINYSIMIPFVVAIVPFLANWFSEMTTGYGLVAFQIYLICLLLFAWLISVHEKKKMVSEKYFIKDVVEVLMQGFPCKNPSSL